MYTPEELEKAMRAAVRTIPSDYDNGYDWFHESDLDTAFELGAKWATEQLVQQLKGYLPTFEEGEADYEVEEPNN